MSTEQQLLWQQLQAGGMVNGDLPEATVLTSPWYLRVLIAMSAWLTALFMLGFIGEAFELIFEQPALAVFVGAAIIALAYKMLGGEATNEFQSQFFLALSFAGQLVLAFGLFKLLDNYDGLVWLAVAVIQAVLAWYMPNYLHRLCSAFIAAIALCVALAHGHVYFIPSGLLLAAVALLWMRELDWLAQQQKIKPIAYGLTLAVIYQTNSGYFYSDMLELVLSVGTRDELIDRPWMGSLTAGLVMLALVWYLLKQHLDIRSTKVISLIMLPTLLFLLASFEAHGISIAVTIMLLGFANGNRLLTGLGIAALLYYVSIYYYLLDTSLLEKSGLLAILGVLLISARFAMRYYQSGAEEVHHAG